MRLFLALAVALALAAPTLAAADLGRSNVSRASHGTSGQSGGAAAAKKKSKRKKSKQRQRRRANDTQAKGAPTGASTTAQDDEIEVKGRLTSL